jgi:hypothetical protein
MMGVKPNRRHLLGHLSLYFHVTSQYTSPPEIHNIILNLYFPPPRTYVKIVPYRTSLPACRPLDILCAS